jgi:dihydroneopterin aldolase
VPDHIRLAGLAFYGYHGVAEEERRLGQRFLIDLDLLLDTRPAAQADDLALTLDYRDAIARVRAVLEGPSVLLIETLVERIADALLAAHPLLAAVGVTLHKPGAAIPAAPTVAVSISIRRERGASPPAG